MVVNIKLHEDRPLLVHALPTLPFSYGIHRGSDQPPTLDLPVIPGVEEQILDPLLRAASRPVTSVIGCRSCHSHPSQREGRALGFPPICHEQTPRVDHAAMGRLQPSTVQRLAVSTQVTQ